MRRRAQRRAIVAARREPRARDGTALGPHAVDRLAAAVHLREPLIGDGREVERRNDDLRPAAVIDRLGDRAERDGDAGRERDLTWCGVDDASVTRAQIAERFPPHVIPRGCAATLPQIEEFRYLAARPLAQCPQRAGIEVDAVPKDGKLAAISGESKRARLYAACERHRPGIYRRNAAYRELVRTLSAFSVEGAGASATRHRFAATRVELSRPRLVSPAAVPAVAPARIHALADVHRVRRRGRRAAG